MHHVWMIYNTEQAQFLQLWNAICCNVHLLHCQLLT